MTTTVSETRRRGVWRTLWHYWKLGINPPPAPRFCDAEIDGHGFGNWTPCHRPLGHDGPHCGGRFIWEDDR